MFLYFPLNCIKFSSVKIKWDHEWSVLLIQAQLCQRLQCQKLIALVNPVLIRLKELAKASFILKGNFYELPRLFPYRVIPSSLGICLPQATYTNCSLSLGLMVVVIPLEWTQPTWSQFFCMCVCHFLIASSTQISRSSNAGHDNIP